MEETDSQALPHSTARCSSSQSPWISDYRYRTLNLNSAYLALPEFAVSCWATCTEIDSHFLGKIQEARIKTPQKTQTHFHLALDIISNFTLFFLRILRDPTRYGAFPSTVHFPLTFLIHSDYREELRTNLETILSTESKLITQFL